MKGQISFLELPKYVPGRNWLDSTPPFGDRGIVLRGFDYAKSDVSAPPLEDDFMAFYVAGTARALRRVNGRSQAASVGPGRLSFLPRGAECTWGWDDAISVIHVYLPNAAVKRTYAALSPGDPDRLVLHDTLDVDDPLLVRLVSEMADECRGPGMGSLRASSARASAVRRIATSSTAVWSGQRPCWPIATCRSRKSPTGPVSAIKAISRAFSE